MMERATSTATATTMATNTLNNTNTTATATADRMGLPSTTTNTMKNYVAFLFQFVIFTINGGIHGQQGQRISIVIVIDIIINHNTIIKDQQEELHCFVK